MEWADIEYKQERESAREFFFNVVIIRTEYTIYSVWACLCDGARACAGAEVAFCNVCLLQYRPYSNGLNRHLKSPLSPLSPLSLLHRERRRCDDGRLARSSRVLSDGPNYL
jgi:hypothetical protein